MSRCCDRTRRLLSQITFTFICAVLKANTQLRDALQAALKAVIADGTYDQILTKWNLLDGEIPASQIVVTPSPSTS